MQTEVLVAIVTGAVALLVAVTSGVLSRRASPYSALSDRVVRLEDKVSTQEREIDALKAHDRAHAVVLQAHAAWDARALAALPPETATALGAIPPLYPPESQGG